ncbi:polynucleotidyl transferase, ribonuclease H-like superfamily protein 1 [Tanacetum coccineum]
MGAAESTSRTNGTNQEEEERKQKSSIVVGAAATIAAVGVAAWGISRMLSDNTDTQETEPSFLLHKRHKEEYEGKSQTSGITWSPPPPGRFKMNTDGSHRHKEEYVGPEIDSAKLHPSGYGGILRDHNGKWIRGFKGYIGVTDNQTAELYGIHKGLELLDKLGYKGAILETDCKGAHEYVTRRDEDQGNKKSIRDSWKIIKECRKLADKNNIVVLHIGRDANKCADRLAKSAIKKQGKYEELIVLPDEIDHLVSEDAKLKFR